MTLKEAAASLGVQAATLRRQIMLGRLLAKKVGRDWTISKLELERYQREVQRPIPLASRFWSHVDTSGGPEACWPYSSKRYGRVWHGSRKRQATHIALELVGRPVPPGLDALHSCDNPPCVNPAHLTVGTPTDNGRDMSMKRRAGPQNRPALRGEQVSGSKLTAERVSAARRDVEAGASLTDVAARYGVTKQAIWFAVRRRTWKHIP